MKFRILKIPIICTKTQPSNNKEGLLPPRLPGTVRATFIAYGSRISLAVWVCSPITDFCQYASRHSASLKYILSWVSLLSCNETLVPRLHPFRSGESPYPTHYRQAFGFLGLPIPSTPFVGLATSIPQNEECVRFSKFRNMDNMDVLGAICRPGIVRSFVILLRKRYNLIPHHFGSSVTVWFRLSAFTTLTTLTMIQHLLRHDILSLAD